MIRNLRTEQFAMGTSLVLDLVCQAARYLLTRSERRLKVVEATPDIACNTLIIHA